jgi:hypothetical protein
MLTDSEGKISPGTFPEPSAYPGSIEIYASNLRTAGERISGLGADINSSWGGLTSCYQAPEAGELYTVLNPVATDGNTVQGAMNRAATALDNFAEDLTSIKSRWSTLRTDAYELLGRIAEKGDDWRDAEGIKGFFGIGESPLVEENNRLRDRGIGIIEDYMEAERVCANAINLFVPDRTRFEAAPSGSGDLDPNVFYHGFEQDLSELATEWGLVGATTDEHWWVDAGTAVWDFGVGAVEGLGAAVGAHSSEGWFAMSWDDALMENWEGTLQSVASLAGMYDAESDSYGWAGWDNVGEAWKDAAHAVVPWEEWGERPGYVIGTALLNIGVTVAGAALTATGVGAAVGVPLLAWRGASILNKMGGSRLPDMDVSSGNSPISIQLNLPNFAGGNRKLFEFNLPGFGGVDPSRIQDMQNALARFAERTEGTDGTGDSGSPSGTRPRGDDDTSTTNQNRRTNQDSGYTVEDLQDGMTVEDILELNALGEQFDPDFRRADAEQAAGRDSWEGSGDGDDGRELEYAGLRRGPDYMEDAATPDTPRNQRLDLSSGPDSVDDLPDGFRPDGPDMTDRSPTVTNSVDSDTRPSGTPANGNDGTNNGHVDDQADGGRTVTTGGGNGTGPTGGPGSGLPGDGDGDSEPLDPNRRDATTRGPRTQEVIRELGLDGNTTWPEFAEKFADLVSRRPDLFNEFYDLGGSRRSVEIKIGGHTIPVLTRPGGSGPWISRDTLATPDKPDYLQLTNGNRITVEADLDNPWVSHLDDMADRRDRAIEADIEAEQALRDARNQHPAGSQEIIDAENTHRPLHREMTRASEDFGEDVAELAVREFFDGKHSLELANGDTVDLPGLKEDSPVVHDTRPRNGNHQFDQIWRTDDGGIVIVEAKSSTDTSLGERTIVDGDSAKRVQQGTREYLEDILREMRERGARDSNTTDNEMLLADEIQDALDNDKLHYVEVKGIPDDGLFGGYTFGLFDVSE